MSKDHGGPPDCRGDRQRARRGGDKRCRADYAKGNHLVRPIVHRVLVQLAGLHYDGTEESRVALVQKLPLVGFMPSPSEIATR